VSDVRPLRVAVEVNPRVVGGTERFLASLLPGLDRTQFEPVVVSDDDGPTDALFRRHGIETVVVPYTTAETPLAEVSAALQHRRIDLVQSSYFSPVLGLAAAQAGVPHVWRFGGHITVVHESQTPREKQTFLALATFLSRRIVCGSAFLARQFELIRHQDVDVIYNGLDVDEFGGASAETGAGPRVAMLAHLVPQKRHEDFIRAALPVLQRVPGAKFDVFGTCYPSLESQRYAQSLRELVAALDLGGVVQFSHLDARRLEVLRSVDVFVLPSVNEGASNAILEAMALGKPVVAADSGGNPELVRHGVTGFLIPPNSPGMLADRVAQLLESPVMAAAFGQAGRERVAREFSIRTCASRYEHMYRTLVGGAA
jgi:glycosyltransferase involved in cell wall biosynthesis